MGFPIPISIRVSRLIHLLVLLDEGLGDKIKASSKGSADSGFRCKNALHATGIRRYEGLTCKLH